MFNNDLIYKTILTEKSEGVIYSIKNYSIRKVYKLYEVIRYDGDYYTHLKNYDKLSEAIERIAEELKKGEIVEMKNKEELIEWCWLNLEFYNNPENWEDTYIIDILNGFNGNCYTKDGKVVTYSQIRGIFEY